MSPLAEDFFDFIPEPIRGTFRGIAFEAMWLHAKWNVYSQLFQGERDQLALLDATAPACFRVIHDSMKSDIHLALARLIDPPSSYGRKNLSLPALAALLVEQGHASTASAFQEKLDALCALCGPIRTRRNRRLAHTDMETSLTLKEQPLPLIPPDLVNQALSYVRDILNTVEHAFRDSETGYQAVMLRGDGKVMLHFLRRGVEASESDRVQRLAQIRKLAES